MKTTKNYGLKKPESSDFYNVDDFNENADAIDEKLKELETPTYTEATSLQKLVSGEKLSVAFGKIAKLVGSAIAHFATKATLNTTGHVKLSDSSAVTDSTGLALPATEKNAAIGGTLANQISKVNSDLGKKAPTSHASTATTYGVGDASNYGHVKLSDIYTSNVGGASNSLAASQSAVWNAYNALNNAKAPKSSPTIYDPTIIFNFENDSGLTEANLRKAGGAGTQGLAIITKVNGTSIFNNLINNDGTANFVAKSDIVVDKFSVDNQTIAANTYGDVDISVAKSGYTPIGIIGFDFNNASTNGANSSRCTPYSMYLNGNKAHFDIRNDATNKAIIKATVTVLFIRT